MEEGLASHSTSDPHIGLSIGESTDRMEDIQRLFQEVEVAYQACQAIRPGIMPHDQRLRLAMQKVRACLDGDYQALWRMSQQELEEARHRARRVQFAVPPSADPTPRPSVEVTAQVVAKQEATTLFREASPTTDVVQTRKFVLKPLPSLPSLPSSQLDLGQSVAYVDSPV